MRVPPEIDRLMWAIAEEANDRAADEFVRRYPGYADEFARRQKAVLNLRASRPVGHPPSAASPIPRFVPRSAPAADPRRFAVAGFLVLAALAAASYTVTSLVTHQPSMPSAIVTPRTTRPPFSAPSVVKSVRPPEETGNEPPNGPPSDNPTEAAKTDQPITLVFKGGTPLRTVLKMLEMEAGVTIVAAPGLPNPDVSAEYRDQSAMSILRDLGRQYGFTPFDQGDGTINVFPAVDHRYAPEPGKGPPRRIGG